jgi:restriction endonuclease S subunit
MIMRMKGIIAQMIRLGDIASIRSGSPFRERILHEANGRYLVIQGKDVGSDGALTLEGMIRIIEVPGKGSPDTLSAGEVVLQTRGVSYRAAVVPRTDAPMVAAGSLYVLSVDAQRVIPEYLVLFLNLPSTQTALRQLATGSTILNLRRSAIEDVELPLPPLSDQRRLIDLGQLVRREADLTARLNLLRLQELHALMIERAKKAGGASTPPASNRSGRRG